MKKIKTDLLIVGGGPVGLLAAYLAKISGIKALVVEKNKEATKLGKADALNARTLQLFETVGLFHDLYPLGKPCNTSSVWKDGSFVSRESKWWDNLEGCFHKHFLMLGQSYVEALLEKKLEEEETPPLRGLEVKDIELKEEVCFTRLSDETLVESSYILGADGAHSFVRKRFSIPFEIEHPEIIWAVLDGVIESDFPKVPEIIVFQNETSDVAWIPREGELDRFYVRMDRMDFSKEEAISKISRSLKPHSFSFKKLAWSSKFSVRESVAEKFFVKDRVFLAGDACHIHSVNGGQGLNTGVGDAFNLVWKLALVIKKKASKNLLKTYEEERKSVALGVVETSKKLVRSTKFGENDQHARNYVKIVEERASYITGMGVSYISSSGEKKRLHDLEIYEGSEKKRLYSLLSYSHLTLLVFSEEDLDWCLPDFVKKIQISSNGETSSFYTKEKTLYDQKILLVRPDTYIESLKPLSSSVEIFQRLLSFETLA